MGTVRINKLIAHSGVASRRQAEVWIKEGRVTVDGVVAHLGQQVDPEVAAVEIDGVPLPVRPDVVYYLINKPIGVVSTMDDPHGRDTVADLVPAFPRVYPVGRLDQDSAGMLLLTNDGDLTLRLTHPRFGVPKVYSVLVDGMVSASQRKQLVDGVLLEDGVARAETVDLLDQHKDSTLLSITMTEGRNRVVRRMIESIGHSVVSLFRTSIGPLADAELRSGDYRPVTTDEVRALYQATQPDEGARSSVSPKAVKPSGPVFGVVTPPGSKSITNRALLIAALADGVSQLKRPLESDDTVVMRRALSDLGAVIDSTGGDWTITGGVLDRPGAQRLLDVGASGTSARFLAALAALVAGPTTIDGTARMRQRPIGGLVSVLEAMGAEIVATGDGGYLPLTVRGTAPPSGGIITIDARRSSQFVSAAMMIAPYADKPVRLDYVDGYAISTPYIATTAHVMNAFGVASEVTESWVAVDQGRYRPTTLEIEPDASAAVYPWVAAAVTGGAVRVEGIGSSSVQADIGALEVLKEMGCTVTDNLSGITVRGPKQLAPVDVDMNACPDAVLAIAVAALFASGTSHIRNIASLRVKETDRLDALANELSKLGATVSTTADSISVTPGAPRGATVETYDDHRMAMAFSLAGLVIPGVAIGDPECVSKTWPSFFADLERLVEVEHAVVAVDGPGGSGKTTVSRQVAERLGIRHLDTGAFYRAATVLVLEAGTSPDDEDAVVELVASHTYQYRDGAMYVDDRDVSDAIREEAVNRAVSAVSAIEGVRSLMVANQRDWLGAAGGIGVVEGRDIGSIVFPEAAVKIYLTASEEARARRRAEEADASVSDIAQGLRRRDRADSSREASPLQVAPDARVIDTTDLDIEQVVGQIVALASGVLRD